MEGLCDECNASERCLPDGRTDVVKYMQEAVTKNHPKCVKALVKAGADVNQKTPLIDAASSGFNDCVTLLVEAGADVNISYIDGSTPLMFAALKGYADCVETLINAGADVNKLTTDDRTNAVTYAATGGDARCLETLIKAGADVNRAAWDGSTALHRAASHESSKCVKLLLEAGANVNALDRYGQPPVAYAIHYESLSLLLKAGADVNAKDAAGSPIIISAAEHGRYDCLKELVTAGADVNSTSNKWASALHALMHYRKDELGSELRLECAKLLLRAGAKVNVFQVVGPNYKYNALSVYILDLFESSGAQPNKEVCMLLYAAGETIDGPTVNGLNTRAPVPEYLLRKLDICLKRMCRHVIRNHLISLDPQNHLFNRIPQLDLLSSSTKFLLYNMSLDDNDDDSDTDGVIKAMTTL